MGGMVVMGAMGAMARELNLLTLASQIKLHIIEIIFLQIANFKSQIDHIRLSAPYAVVTESLDPQTGGTYFFLLLFKSEK